MRKICAFLASVLLVTTLAMSFGPVQTAQAFSSAEIDYSDFTFYSRSSKAGESVGFFYNWYNSDPDMTGWKLALCPNANSTYEEAVVAFDITNADKKAYENGDNGGYLSVQKKLQSDIPEGFYISVLYDAEGNSVFSSYPSEYVNKTLLAFSYALLGDDGYVYAYVYSESPVVNADTYPILYGIDRQTAVTSFEDYTTTTSKDGETIHWYKLKMLDKSQFAMTDGYEGVLYQTTLYSKVNGGTPVVSTTVSGNNVAAVNDGGLALISQDEAGFGYAVVRDVVLLAEKNNEEKPVNPFNKAEADADDEDDEDEDEEFAYATTVNGVSVEVSVHGIKGSDNSAVQASVEKLIAWVSQVAGDQSALVKALNQYAPSMKVGRVLAGGTLDLELEEDVNISSGASITFSNEEIAEQVASGDKIVLLHVKHDGTIEYIPAAAENGAITGTFTSLSPVAWFKVEASAKSGLTSPKTGFDFWDFLVKLFG